MTYTDEWLGCYRGGWGNLLVPEAFAHPAKVARGLAEKIYSHVIAEGWVKAGDSVVDPFGGIAGCGFHAMMNGLHFVGVELEEKFVGLGNQNIALWNDRYSRMPNWGSARLIQGDSRKLASVLSEARIAVSSPPYVSGGHHTDVMGAWNANGRGHGVSKDEAGYGASEGQLGAMKEGDLNLAISSPPYVNSVNSSKSGIDWDKAKRPEQWQGNRDRNGCQAAASHRMQYGPADGQLGSMKEGSFDCTITSPPYESGCQQTGRDLHPERMNGPYAPIAVYSNNGENAGNMRGEDFWSASRIILEQLYSILMPGAHAVLVVKAFVRNKQIVDFPAQWSQLCQAVGFELLHDHHALLTENYGIQGGFETDKELTVARKSFFRRLAESKGSPKIDYENVLCFRRP